MTTVLGTPRTVGHVIHAKLTTDERIAGSFGPGFGGYHWRPRQVLVTMHHGPTGWYPIRVSVKGRTLLPGHRFGISARWWLGKSDLPQRPLPGWLAEVVGQVTAGWEPES